MTPSPGTDPEDAADRLSARADPTVGRSLGGRFEIQPEGHPPMLADLPDRDGPVPLVVMFHGAGGDPFQSMNVIADAALERGVGVLAPASVGATWDVVLGGYGADVRGVDAALSEVFALHPVDPARIALAGFSDGASYALSLGVANGDLVDAVLAFSPGFLAPVSQVGRPRVFACHGTSDPVLDIDRTARVVVPQLRAWGHDVRYEEFDDGHVMPPRYVAAALDWFREG